MKTRSELMVECISKSNPPSRDRLIELIAECAVDRDKYHRVAEDMGHWMSSMVTAHLFKDSHALTDILNEFIRTRVKMQSDQTTPLH
jgi:hypothetical protein